MVEILAAVATLQLPVRAMEAEVPVFLQCDNLRKLAIVVLRSVMPEGDLGVTVPLVMIVLVVSLVCCVWFKPRRSDTQNALDRFISLVEIIVLSFGIISVHGEAVSYQCRLDAWP